MKRHTAIVLVLCSLFAFRLAAQQEQQYTQYMVNSFVLNPAVAGSENFIDLKAGYRQQWTGQELAPRTIYVSGHSSLKKGHGTGTNRHRKSKKFWHGVGGYAYSDEAGPFTQTAFYGSYAWHQPVSNDFTLSFGTFIGAKQHRLDGSNWDAYHDNDNLLVDRTFTKIVPDASFGAFLYSRKYFVGLSSMQMLGGNVGFDGLQGGAQISESRLRRHYFFTAGTKVPLTYDLILMPSMAVKAVQPAPVSVDVNAMLQYKDLFFGGMSWRAGDAFSAIAGVVLAKQYEISYSYDVSVSKLNPYNSGSHEIVIGYRLKHPGHVDCPSRWWR